MSNDMLLIRNYCSPGAIDPAYRTLIEAAVGAYRDVLGSRVEEIRLLGSVARGDATPGLSDIDFLALTGARPSDGECAALGQRAAALGSHYPIVSRVDLEVSGRDGLHPAQRFILTSDSLAVAGTDRLTLREQMIDRDTLIALVTLPMAQLIDDYGKALEQIDRGDTARLRFWSRLIGKDILKSLRGVALRRGAEYERSIAAIAEQATAYFPGSATTIALLYGCYRAPTVDRAMLLRALDEAARLPS